uniref:Uncharacterized protein n=1 Tax=Periophthalmus magnuspinnatus TaxID=409849 RepID=A0A3B4BF44_9GOBI
MRRVRATNAAILSTLRVTATDVSVICHYSIVECLDQYVIEIVLSFRTGHWVPCYAGSCKGVGRRSYQEAPLLLPLVLFAGDSHLSSIVDKRVHLPEDSFTFGFSCTPGATASQLQMELGADYPDLLCLLAPSNMPRDHITPIDEAARTFKNLLASAKEKCGKVCVIDFPPRLSFNDEYQTALGQEYHRVAATAGVTYHLLAHHFSMSDTKLWATDGVRAMIQFYFHFDFIHICIYAVDNIFFFSFSCFRPISVMTMASAFLSSSCWTHALTSSSGLLPVGIPLSPVLFSPAMAVEMENICLSSGDKPTSCPATEKVISTC